MCLIAFAINATAACPLLIAANRDEFFDRPTAAWHRWTRDGEGGVWAGRDLRDGGTWLGVSESGRVAMLTNVRSAQVGPGARSRGELAARWLQGDGSLDALIRQIDPAAYAGFNLVVGDGRSGDWVWLGNRDPQQPHQEGTPAHLHQRRLGPGIYGLSNAALDTPWPKTRRLKEAMGLALAQPGDWLAPLSEALADDTPAPGHELPDTGVPKELETGLSSPFVRLPEHGYGTRSSLVLRVWPGGSAAERVELHEWTHTPQGWNAGSHSRHQMRW
ncbi:MAG: hypothetical protein C0443_09470 [Comamonadaceae bacterium]|nr:hypothetical protein [Comamonadaceae bacterium]